ncbi:hypothetical protein M0812_07432 [Anaeramoeba flamelloides]|uniref:Transposase n=1 Tax=Anaeramoeba flamelloides TaxID=1746091 RepID=A0AAV8A587_9EUKA|nr:hypothetical protein M0812_07432 [Anaeramoeba flamelloides]
MKFRAFLNEAWYFFFNISRSTLNRQFNLLLQNKPIRKRGRPRKLNGELDKKLKNWVEEKIKSKKAPIKKEVKTQANVLIREENLLKGSDLKEIQTIQCTYNWVKRVGLNFSKSCEVAKKKLKIDPQEIKKIFFEFKKINS